MFYCGDDEDAKKNSSQGLIREAGLEPTDAGPLKSSRYLEPLAMLMIQLGYATGVWRDQHCHESDQNAEVTTHCCRYGNDLPLLPIPI